LYYKELENGNFEQTGFFANLKGLRALRTAGTSARDGRQNCLKNALTRYNPWHKIRAKEFIDEHWGNEIHFWLIVIRAVFLQQYGFVCINLCFYIPWYVGIYIINGKREEKQNTIGDNIFNGYGISISS
jgi:hypothetical protein